MRRSLSRTFLVGFAVASGLLYFVQSFTITQQRKQSSCRSILIRHSKPDDSTPTDDSLINKDQFINAIKTLNPEEAFTDSTIEKVMVALPIEHVGGISLADCGPLVLINEITPEAAEATDIKPYDTIVGISAKDFAGEVGFGDVMGENLQKVAEVYTKAIKYAAGNGFGSLELKLQRLVASSKE